jgi:NADP-dependent 3-hydroxy acid dehydrogenase YdfG
MATAVVTGAASGIGRAVATRLSAKGYPVHLADVASTTELARSIDGVSHVVDVSDANVMDRLAEAATEPSRILITASLAGLVTFPGGGAYAATKHAVVAVAEQAAMDCLARTYPSRSCAPPSCAAGCLMSVSIQTTSPWPLSMQPRQAPSSSSRTSGRTP